MPYEPYDQEQIYRDLRDRITGRTDKLTNFEEESLNYVLTHDGYSGHFTRFEHALLAVQLSGWIETAGGPIEEDDLIRLDIDPGQVNLNTLNEYMDDSDLDELALQNGVTRDPGDRAEGNIRFLTVDEDVTIEAGVVVTTERDRFGERLEYVTTEETEAQEGTTSATAHVEAREIGPDYNVGPGSIRNMPSVPGGVRDVINDEAITGGEPPETNAELRERAKQAIVEQSGGGTVEGIQGAIVQTIDGVDEDNVYIEEHYNPPDRSPWVEVTVDGGEDRLVQDAIDQFHSTGIEHILNRPTEYLVEVDVVLSGSPINLQRVESEITRYISEVGLGEDVNRAGLIQAIMNSDNDISNIESLQIWSSRTGTIEGDLELEPDEKVEPGNVSVEV